MAKITRFFENVVVEPSGLEIRDIINGNKYIHNGTIDQIIIAQASGSATSMEVQIRYEVNNSDRHKLVYLYVDAPLPLHVDSEIDAQFSLQNPKTQGDLHLFIQPDSTCTLNIRIDMDIFTISGL